MVAPLGRIAIATALIPIVTMTGAAALPVDSGVHREAAVGVGVGHETGEVLLLFAKVKLLRQNTGVKGDGVGGLSARSEKMEMLKFYTMMVSVMKTWIRDMFAWYP